jgi:putative peptide zinc metalloprotease protein
MKPPTAASDLERRKKVRLRVRLDLQINPQRYEGRTYYVIKDPVSLRYYRFKEQEHFLIRMMDGKQTLDDAQKAFEKRFRPDRLTLEDLEHFGQQLLKAGLAQNESPQAGKQLFDRRKERRRTELLQTFTNILYIKIPVFDPERLLLRMLPWLRFMFTSTFLVLSAFIMLGAVSLVISHWTTFYDRLPSYQQFFQFQTVVYLWAALGIVKVIHEFGHGLSCKAFGGEVHEMGLLFLCFSPCMYCNVSDAWTLPNKWKRIIISGAGIYVELMIAAIATFVWWNTPGQPFVNNVSLSLMIVCSVSTVMFNGNPLMRYDGYYVLADWLEIPNLRDRANRYLQRMVMEHCLGIEVQPEPYMELGRQILFLFYAIVSWVYRWVVTFVVLKFMSGFLKPYKLEVLSTMLAMMALGSMIGWPLFRLAKNIHKRGRLPDMKSVRVVITSAVVLAVVVAFFFLPLPYVSRVRQLGLVELQPGAVAKVSVLVPSTPEKIYVTEGQAVRKGAELAQFGSLALSEREFTFKAQKHEQDRLIEKLKGELRQVTGSEESQIRQRLSEAIAQSKKVEGQLLGVEQDKRLLVLKAPRDGHVMGLPAAENIYRPWEKADLEKPFCQVGDPTKLIILVPVAPEDFDLIRTDEAYLKAQGRELEVTIRIHGFGSRTWSGRVHRLPATAEKTVPIQLTTKGGGPLATRPGTDPNNPEPQGQVYLVGIEFETAQDRAISPGTLGQVKIHCRYRSGAWWVWRTLSSTFDLGLW